MSIFKIEQTNDEKKWDKFLLLSLNKNIYTSSLFIKNLKNKYIKFFLMKEKEIFASFFLNVDDKSLVLTNEIIYTPLIFKDYQNKPYASRVSEKFEIINSFKNFLVDNYSKINFISDYFLDDLRPFYWHNFEKKKTIFSIKDTKFTNIINLQKFNNKSNFKNSEFYKDLSVRIRQQYNYAHTRNKYELIKDFNKKIFKNIVLKTFERQGVIAGYDVDLQISILEQLYKTGSVNMYYTVENKKILSFSIFGCVKNNAIYLHGGRLTDSANDYSQTFTLIESFIDLKKQGIDTVDLEGINSPKRGFNKIGYGGQIKPYYHISNH